MLNIISKSIVSRHTRGPRKVVLNLMKGLDEIGYPYVVNASLHATNTLWIHDDKEALTEASKLPNNPSIVAGPNIYTLPNELPNNLDTSRITWIHPATWVQKFWNIPPTKTLTSIVWPVGIDTTKFLPNLTIPKDLILIYNKQRKDEEVNNVCKALESIGEKFEVVTYGKYREEDYLNLLQKCKAIIWIGRSESQGIGLLEALSMNVPILVWNIKRFGEWFGTGHERFSKQQLDFNQATTIPYFDNTCGISFSEESELNISLSRFLDNICTFKPREYVINNLSLSKQAKEFINIYKSRLGVTEDELLSTHLSNSKKWKNDKLIFRIETRLKDMARCIIN